MRKQTAAESGRAPGAENHGYKQPSSKGTRRAETGPALLESPMAGVWAHEAVGLVPGVAIYDVLREPIGLEVSGSWSLLSQP